MINRFIVMKKIFNAIWNYVQIDGLLHFLVCYAIAITFALADPSIFPIAGTMVAVFCAIIKECWDASYKHATKKQIIHDLVFDALGILIVIGICLLRR